MELPVDVPGTIEGKPGGITPLFSPGMRGGAAAGVRMG